MPNKNLLLALLCLITLSVGIHHHFADYLENLFDKMSSFSESSPAKSKVTIQAPKEYRANTLSSAASSRTKQKQVVKKSKISMQRCQSTEFVERTSANQKYYELNTNLGEGYQRFLSDLQLRLDVVFEHLERHLDITLNKTVMLNLVFQTSREDYEDYVRGLGSVAKGNQGQYLNGLNLAIIQMHQSYERTLEIAIHEAIHAFNKIYWGPTLRFFNEGMAEYSAFVTQDGTLAEFDFSYFKHQSYPMEIPVLLQYEGDWHIGNNHELYNNSKALFYFLMSHEQGRQVISQIMQLEMQNYCSRLSSDTIENILRDTFLNHETEFNYWFSDNLYIFLNQSS